MSGVWAASGCASWLLIGVVIGSIAALAWVAYYDRKNDIEWKRQAAADERERRPWRFYGLLDDAMLEARGEFPKASTAEDCDRAFAAGFRLAEDLLDGPGAAGRARQITQHRGAA